ncbi:MAG TPA: hypothetical protein VN861_03060 [Candidatus Acidoferrales bacterium]|nr:hypothetical protein [Candidatus Acidoferrales bacterium]
MGSVKITVELKCAQCGKKLSVHGKMKHGRKRMGSWVVMPGVWKTDWYVREGQPIQESSIQITKGVSYSDGDDEDLYCSKECVLEFVTGVLPRLKADGDNDD